MKNELQKVLLMSCKFIFYGSFLQVLFVGMLVANTGNAQEQLSVKQVYVNLDLKNANITEVFKVIESQTNFKFFYDRKSIDRSIKLDLNFYSASLHDVLLKMSKEAGLRFKQVNSTINVKKNYDQNLNPQKAVEILIQTRSITGKVTTYEEGEGLPGVNVIEKGTSNGTVTNVEGEYTLEVSEGATLVFSSVGYTLEEIEIGNRSVIDLVMTADIQQLQELVVVGYGTQKEKNVTGAISSIKVEEIEGRPFTDMTQSLAGLAPGVQVTQVSGQPGQDNATIRIRGIGTLTSDGQGPLTLVDGIESEINGLDPNDIESITVLKDAASAAIYGSRAANGVILITTKKGRKGEARLNYNGYYGWQSPTRLMPLITDMTTHMELLNEAKTNLDRQPQFPQSEIDSYRQNNDPITHPNTDWFDYFFGTPTPITNHNISASGGNDQALYNLSVGYLNQDGLEGETSNERYNIRINTDFQLSKKLKVGTNLYSYWQTLKGNRNVMDIIKDGAGSPGVLPVHPDGRFGGPQVEGEGFVGNPVATLASQDQTRVNQFFLGKLYAEYEFFDGFTFQTNAALKFNNFKSKNISSPFILWDFRNDQIARESNQIVINLGEANDYDRNITLFSTLNYTKSIEKHNLNFLAGYNLETFQSERFSAGIRDLFSEATPVLDAGTSEPSVGGTFTEWALVSYFGRFNYDFDGKYLFEANIRYDGSSRFDRDNRWGVFPSFSVGWRVSDEPFMSQFDFLSDFKLRASWGQLGNQNIGSNYPYQPIYSLDPRYNFGGQLRAGAAQTNLPNRNIQWETTTSTDIGFDVSLFENKFEASFDYFSRLTDDILVQLPIPYTLGDKAPPFQNIAQVRNRGWELITSYREIIGDFNFGVSFNLTQVENEVVKFTGETPAIDGVFIIQEGLPYQSIFAYNNLGIFQTDEEVNDHAVQDPNLTAPGDLKYQDFDNNGVINESDRQIVGNTIPKYLYGFNFNMGFKGIDMSAIFQGIADVDRYLQGQFVQPFATNDRTLTPTFWLDRWTPENPSTTVPRVIIGGDYSWNYRGSTYWMQNGAFLRLKNLQLGYTLPNSLIERLNLQRVRFYANAQNLLTITDYEGYDPESNITSRDVGYPNTRIMSLGLQLGF